VAGQPIYASQFNINMTDLFGGLTNTLTRDGQSPASANLPMNGYKHTGAANASASGQYTVWGQQVTFAGITQASGYYNLHPYNASFDDGSYSRFYWDGNNGKLVFQRSSGGTGTPGVAIQANSFIGALVGNADTASAVAWSGVTGKPAAVTALSGTNTGDQTTITGNAGTATKLATARTIDITGVTATATSFDGSANISIPITAVPAALLTGTIAADTATALATARNLNGASFNGTASITVPTNVVTDATAANQYVLFAAASGNVESRVNSGIRFDPSSNTLIVSGEIITASNTPTGDYSVGFRKVPRSTSATISRLYNGFCKSLSAGVTIPSATFEAGDSFSIYNNSASAFNLTQGSGLTMRGPNGSTGTLSLAAYGMAVLWFDSASVVKVMGEVS
jgi:hypothetical protein